MSLWDKFKRALGFRPPARKVARLAGEDASLDDVIEEIESGGPLKPMHRRTIIRDRRLLPKKRSEKYSMFHGRKRVMSREEADRFFAPTMRTRNRNIRDLVADENQLNSYGLPLWKTESDVADALGITAGMLRHYSIHRNADPVRHYVTFAIPKRSGGERLIHAPKRRLKGVQRQLLNLLIEKLPVSNAAHGFRNARSIATGAAPHVGKRILVQFDLKDFFPSVTMQRVRGMLLAYGYSYPVATTIAVLTTEAERQPVMINEKLIYVPVSERVCVQGAPTSPGLCNAICLRLDRRLTGLARKLGFTYTRYADDLTFSGDNTERVGGVLAAVCEIIRDEGFQVNRKKTRIKRSGGAQKVTGVTVNKVIGLNRKERRKLRAALHQSAKNGKPISPQLRGKIAYLNMLNPQQAKALISKSKD